MFFSKWVKSYCGVLAIIVAIAAPGPGFAQSSIPPRQDARSPTGVSYRNGAFSWQEQDLSIGGPDGLSLNRSYLSSMGGTGAIYNGAGWTHNFVSLVTNRQVPHHPDFPSQNPNYEQWLFDFAIGDRSYSYIGGSIYPNIGGPMGTYSPVSQNGTTLEYTGTTAANGHYILTAADGAVITFSGGINSHVVSWVKADGTRLDYSYVNGRVTSIISSRGYAILFDGAAKACAVNMAVDYVTSSSTCPSGVQTVTYTYAPGSYNTAPQMMSATKAGGTTTYAYVGADHLGCIKEPGQTVCKISNQYAVCPIEEPPYAPVGNLGFEQRYKDYVTLQTTGTGETYAYTYAINDGNSDLCDFTHPYSDENTNMRDYSYITSTVTDKAGGVVTVGVNVAGMVGGVSDQLNRGTGTSYAENSFWGLEQTLPIGTHYSEGNYIEYTYDGRGNIITETRHPKPGSSQANIVIQYVYPSSCTAAVTCHKPTSVTDARANTTGYAYDPAHGGVLTETGPAVGGIQPVKRYAYVQRYAWIKNASGGYVHAATPVWLLSSQKTCRSSATVSGACAAGASDEVVTSYDYGPDSGPNTLLLRGVVVTADVSGASISLRTCYGYDRDGNKISETSPRAGLTVCS